MKEEYRFKDWEENLIRNTLVRDSIVVVSGGFDPPHRGHINIFRAADEIGNVIVALNSDEWLIRKKGKPFMNWLNRFELLMSIRYVAAVISFDDFDDTAADAMKKARLDFPDKKIYFANGGDRIESNVPQRELDAAKEYNIKLIWGVGGNNKVESSSNFLKECADYSILLYKDKKLEGY